MDKSSAAQASMDVDDDAHNLFTIIVRTADGLDGDLRLTMVSSYSVNQLKSKISESHPFKPNPAKQRLIYGGRMLRDEEQLISVLTFDNEEKTHVVHLVFPRVPNPPPGRTYVKAIRRLGKPTAQGPSGEACRPQHPTGAATAAMATSQHDSSSRSTGSSTESRRYRYFLWYDLASESAGGRERVGGGDGERSSEGLSGDIGLLGNYERRAAHLRHILSQELGRRQGALAASLQPLFHANDSEQIAESDSDDVEMTDSYDSEEDDDDDDDDDAAAEAYNGDWEQPRRQNQALIVVKLAIFVFLFGRDASHSRLVVLVTVAILLFLSQSDWVNAERLWSLLGLNTTPQPAAPSDSNAIEPEVQRESAMLRPSVLEEIEQFLVQFFVALNPGSDATSLQGGMAG